MEDDLQKLRRDVRRLKVFAALSGVLIFVLGLAAWGPLHQGRDVLRARGLVIEDAQSRARILLGAPIPEVPGRVRTDTARVREAWAHRFPDPDEFMRSYRERVRSSMDGLLILTEDGFDRVALGAPYPDPWFGPRLGPGAGMIVNDDRGTERTGYGVLEVDGGERVVLGLDSQGREGVTLSLLEDGKRGLSVYDGEGTLFLGRAPPGDATTGLEEAFRGLLLRRGDSTVLRLDRTAGVGSTGR